MKILLGQINPTIGDFAGNTQKILRVIESAREKKADVVVFPEMCLCGYQPEDLVLHKAFVEEMEEWLEKIAAASKNLMVVVGMVRRNPAKGEKPLFNTAAVMQDGKFIGFEDKCLLPTYDVFDEKRYFESSKSVKIWNYKGKKIALMICEDIWQHAGLVEYTDYEHDPVLDLVKEKPDFLINISSSPYHFQKPEVRIKVCAASAKTLKCPVFLCCQVGGNDQIIYDGYSIFVDAEGKLRQSAAGFKEDELLVDLDNPPSLQEFKYDALQDLYSALVLGVRDYFHKQGFKKGCLGLSGGIDSALVACIAADALGKENVLALVMPSRFSSSESMKDAKLLAKNLQIESMEISIEGPFQAYLDLLEPHFKGKKFDVTEENMQARVRGMILMAISNKLGYIVLGTGNKSELALGYCTLYGDMAAGLGVISDLTKERVYSLSRWINRKKEIIPQSIIERVPTAELRPNQKDTDSLPEYAIVDAVLQDYVEEFLSAEEIAKKQKLSLDIVEDLIHRIHAAEYKRRQAAPGLRVSRKAFGVGRRYPIVQKWK
jgi:NAD+ synthase (glutamine-hydrolysing)